MRHRNPLSTVTWCRQQRGHLQTRGALTRNHTGWHLDLGLPVSRMERKKGLWLKPPSLRCLVVTVRAETPSFLPHNSPLPFFLCMCTGHSACPPPGGNYSRHTVKSSHLCICHRHLCSWILQGTATPLVLGIFNQNRVGLSSRGLLSSAKYLL